MHLCVLFDAKNDTNARDVAAAGLNVIFRTLWEKEMSSKTLFQPTLNGIQDIDLINIVPMNENFLSNIHTCMTQLNYIIMEIIAILNV